MVIINEIFSKVLEEITPTQKEIDLINSISKKLKHLLEVKANELGIQYTTIEPQGSTGIKQTQLKDDYDIDLFVGLDYKNYKHKYNGLTKNKLKKKSKKDFLDLCNNWIIPSLTFKEFQNPGLLYAEHPYVTIDYHHKDVKIKIDIVLYFDLELEVIQEKGPITAVDRSPWHGRFIRDKLNQDQKNDIRLLKQFFKSNHCYGDRTSLGKVGFIGYSAELLIYYFNNISKLFENFNRLRTTPLDYYNRKREELKKIVHFQNDFLIIVDPIDKNRNVASAISERAYNYCNFRITNFLKNPTKDYFKINPVPEMVIKEYSDISPSKVFIIELKNLDKSIHYTINRDKLHSVGEYIRNLGEREFNHTDKFGTIIYEVYFEDNIDEYNLAIYCEKPEISKTYIRKGPSIKEESHANKFKSKNPNYFIKNGNYWVETEREFNNFQLFLSKILRKKIPHNFEIINIANSINTISSSGKKALTILTRMILPFSL
ncbi:MAG: hypothetical protein ACFFDB_04945 [Promethearchaeota archaeon]